MPRSGFDCDARTSRISPVERIVSPGRTGCTQRSSSAPGEPSAASGANTRACTIMRSAVPMVWTPLAMIPP